MQHPAQQLRRRLCVQPPTGAIQQLAGQVPLPRARGHHRLHHPGARIAGVDRQDATRHRQHLRCLARIGQGRGILLQHRHPVRIGGRRLLEPGQRGSQPILGARQFGAQAERARIIRIHRHRAIRRRNGPGLIADRHAQPAQLHPVAHIVGVQRQRALHCQHRRARIPLRQRRARDDARRRRRVALRQIVRPRFAQRSGQVALQEQRLRHHGACRRRRLPQRAGALGLRLRAGAIAQLDQHARLRRARFGIAGIALDRVHQLDSRAAHIVLRQRRQPARQRGAAVALMRTPLPQPRRRQQQGEQPDDQEQA